MRFQFDGMSTKAGLSAALRHLSQKQRPVFASTLEDFERIRALVLDLPELFETGASQNVWTEGVECTRTYIRNQRELGVHVELDECTYRGGADGCLGVAFHVPTVSKQVVRGDMVSSGVALLWEPGQPLRVWPRVFRRVCANGQVSRLGNSHPIELDGRSLPEVLDSVLLGGGFERSIEALRLAANTLVRDPVDRISIVQDRILVHRILQRFKDGIDRTQWALSNAVTAEARFIADPGQRFDLERVGARIAFEPWVQARRAFDAGNRRDAAVRVLHRPRMTTV